MTPPSSAAERRLIAAITAGMFLLLVAYSLLIPTFRNPDEAAHVDLARLMARSTHYPEYDDRYIEDEVMRGVGLSWAGQQGRHLA
ncbi:MAG: hypothetical protein ACT4OV_16655, partial [Microthrixaceae bacterium]